MLSRLLPASVLMVPMALAQSGVFGTPTGHPKAGDPAPDLVFSQVLSAPAQNSWSPTNLSGQVTVLGFFPDTSHNPEPVALWNARVAQYANKHVQFVWITGEDKRTLLPALAQHPIKGWVLYDPEGSTAKAYGLDMPVNIFIGLDRKIIGFEQGIVPDETTLNAVLDNRIVLTRPTPATLKSFIDSNLVALDSVPARMPRAEDHRPHITPSNTVHITPSAAGERGNFSTNDYWVLQGVTLKQAIEEIYGVNPIRTEIPSSLQSSSRYNFTLLLPHPEQHEQMAERFKQALLEHFHLTVDHDTRLTEVYVVSRQPGRTPPLEQLSDRDLSHAGGVGIAAPADFQPSMDVFRPQTLDALVSIAEEGTMDDLCSDLETSLDRPVVNETHLEGRYRLQVQTPAGSKANFLTALRERTGLVITPGQRKMTFLRFRTTTDRAVANLAAPH
jgi:uncharacterized protein (TIGR03435 family)